MLANFSKRLLNPAVITYILLLMMAVVASSVPLFPFPRLVPHRLALAPSSSILEQRGVVLVVEGYLVFSCAICSSNQDESL